jgi:hypothetical protein
MNVGKVRIARLVYKHGQHIFPGPYLLLDIQPVYSLGFRVAARRTTSDELAVDPHFITAVGRDEKLCILGEMGRFPGVWRPEPKIDLMQIEWML